MTARRSLPASRPANPGRASARVCLFLLSGLASFQPKARAQDTGAAEEPVALAGLPLLAYPDDTVQLDGSASYDPSGAAITRWVWDQVGGPPVDLSRGDTATPQFKAGDPGTLSFSLVVSTATASSAPDVVDVIVVDPEAGTRVGEEPGKKGCSTLPVANGPRAPLAGVLGLLVLTGLLTRRPR